MTIESALAFALGMFLLALSPGAGLAAILSRCLGSGMRAGFAVTTGLVLGDFLFMGIAMVGLSAIAAMLGPVFQVLKYAGAAYLLWLGVQAFRSAGGALAINARQGRFRPGRDVGIGLLVTLGNPKPILFYGALLPNFLDMTAIGASDFLTLAAIVVAVSYPVYGGYMLLVERARRTLSSTRAMKRANQATGAMLVGSGVLVASQ